MRCPRCGSVVEPLRDPRGDLLCPACWNSGRIAAAQQPPQPAWAPAAPPFAPPGPPPAPFGPFGPYGPPPIPQPGATPGLAVASLVLGLLGLFLIFTLFFAPLALLTGAVAVGLGIPVLRKGREPPVSGAGRGLAIAGISAGGLSVAVGLVAVLLVGTFFSILDDLEEYPGEAPTLSFERDTAGPGGVLTVAYVDPYVTWEDLEVSGSAGCQAPSGPVAEGDRIVCEVDGRVEVLYLPTYEVLYSTMV